MPKKIPIKKLEERLEKAEKELKERKRIEAKKIQEFNQKRWIKTGALIEKFWNNNAPINPKTVAEILAEIGKNSATMNLISLRIKSAAAGEANAEPEPPKSDLK